MMNARDVLLDSLEKRWRKYRSELKTCRFEFSEEAVHDLRVATRRLLAVFDLLRVVVPRKLAQPSRRTLKEQLDDLDDLRDIQVLLADISEFMHEAPEMSPFRGYLQGREKQLLRLSRGMVKSNKSKTLSARIEKTRAEIASLPDELLSGQLLEVLDEAYEKVTRRLAAVDTEKIATIHKLRIAFKKFRYLIEILHPLLVDFPAENFERMHTYQTMMGEIQDLEVAQQYVHEWADSASVNEPVRTHYAARLKKAVNHFIDDKGEALTFWRSAPDRSFPWEKQP